MKLCAKSILIISPEHWNHIQVSKHHYAIELAQRGNRVFFLNPPTTHYKSSPTSYENLTVLDYPGFWRGMHRLPKAFRMENQRRVLRTLENLVNISFEIIWSFDNSVFFDFDVFGDQVLKISHLVDHGQDFQLARAAKSANICFGVIPEIVSRLKKYNDHSFLIEHGVAMKTCAESRVLPGENRYKALYFGNLAMPNLDWELMMAVVEQNKNCDFVFLGSNIDACPQILAVHSNVYVLPQVPSGELSCFMEAADILMLFYTRDYYRQFAAPHKLLEYLSSGKPIIATFLRLKEELRGLVINANSAEEWMEQFEDLTKNYGLFATKELAIRRMKIAQENSYESKLMYIETLVNEVMS